MMKGTVMTKTALTAAIAESCEVKKGVIAKALSTLASIATAETKKNGKFVVPGLVMIQLLAASPATVPAQHSGLRLFEGAREAVTCDTSGLLKALSAY